MSREWRRRQEAKDGIRTAKCRLDSDLSSGAGTRIQSRIRKIASSKRHGLLVVWKHTPQRLNHSLPIRDAATGVSTRSLHASRVVEEENYLRRNRHEVRATGNKQPRLGAAGTEERGKEESG